MGINRKYLGTVIYNNSITGIKEIFGNPDNSGVGRPNRSSHRRPEIQAIVIAFQLAIENPPIAERAGYLVFNREHKGSFPQSGRTGAGINMFNLLMFTVGPIAIFFVGIDPPGIHFQDIGAVFAHNHIKRKLAGLIAR